MERKHVLVADEVWIAAALLHRENARRTDFSVTEIVERAAREDVEGRAQQRPGVRVHATLHCVANREPNPGRYRMLLETAKGKRRLYRPGDPCHPARKNSKTVPERDSIPKKYRELIDWYWRDYVPQGNGPGRQDPILGLRGLGKEIWVAEKPDEYVRRLREGWE